MTRQQRRQKQRQQRKRMAELAVKAQRRAFKEKFGREMTADDPFSFDENSPSDTPYAMTDDQLVSEMVEAMREAGIPEHLIFAYEQTGLILDEEGYKTTTPEIRKKWDDAMRRFDEMHHDKAE